MRLVVCSALLLFLPAVSGMAQRSDTLRVYFPLDDPFLNAAAEKNLGAFLKRVPPGRNAIIIGYTDYLGDTYYNDMLAMRRAQNTAAYLQKNGMAKNAIKMVFGKGEIARPKEQKNGYAEDRRVDVVFADPTAAVKTKRDSVPKPAQPIATRDTPPPTLISKEAIEATGVGNTLKINNLYFFPGQAIIRPGSEQVLDDLYSILMSNPAVSIGIEGHICCIGIEDEDGIDFATGLRNLSLARAKAVYNFLVRKGIDEKRLKYLGKGHSEPLMKEEKYEWQENMNRRVEIRILAK